MVDGMICGSINESLVWSVGRSMNRWYDLLPSLVFSCDTFFCFFQSQSKSNLNSICYFEKLKRKKTNHQAYVLQILTKFQWFFMFFRLPNVPTHIFRLFMSTVHCSFLSARQHTYNILFLLSIYNRKYTCDWIPMTCIHIMINSLRIYSV